MKAPRFDYSCAAGIDEALNALAQGSGDTKVLGGSQSLGPMLNLRLARPARVVDVARIAELRSVRERGAWIEVGAAVTHAEIEDGVHPPLLQHPLQGVAAGIAYRAVRTRGTIGGSLAHADPAADWVVTLAAMGGRIRLRSPRGERTVDAAAFMVGAYTTVLAFDELIFAISAPSRSSSMRWGYHKLCRKPGEFAEASAAACFEPARKWACIALGAVDGAPVCLDGLAAAVASRDQQAHAVTRDEIEAAVRGALPGRDRVDLKLFTACVERALEQAFPEH